MNGWVPAAGLMIVGLFVTVALAATPGNGGRMTAVFPPWWSQADAFAAAARAGRPIAAGGLEFIILVGDADGASQSGLSQRLRDEGALVLMDGSAFRPCGDTSRTES